MADKKSEQTSDTNRDSAAPTGKKIDDLYI